MLQGSSFSSRGSLHFGDFEMNLEQGALIKRGHKLNLQPQPFRVLWHLLRQAPTIVTRQELGDAIWGSGVHVDLDQSIAYCIRQIRQVLGDSATRPRYVETLPRQGYRFIWRLSSAQDGEKRLEAVPRIMPDSGPHDPTLRHGLQFLSNLPSVAVIPLKVRGPAGDQYLSVSLAEALVHRLLSTGKLVVRPISSLIRFAEEDWSKAAQALNVDLAVEGTIQISGGKIRVLIGVHRLADASTLASLKLDGDVNDLFALQDRLTDIVSDVFVPRQRENAEPPVPPTKHPVAFELYLRAVDRQVHVDKFEMASAIELLTRATELDAAFADAWGLLAQACAQMGAHLDRDPKWFKLGEYAIARTLELDPAQCTALCAKSMILWSPSRGFQNRAALRALNAAIKIDPTRPTARHQRSALLWHLGFHDAAEKDANELQATSPALGLMHQGAIALMRGEFDLSAEVYARMLEIEPNGVLNHLMAPVAVLFAGRLKEARQALGKARLLFPSESFSLGLESILEAIEGDRGRAETLADEAARSVQSLTHTHHTWHSCAAAYALIGRPEKAMYELRRCGEMGLPNYRLFGVDPYLQGLLKEAGFRELMTELRREHDSIRDEFGLEDDAFHLPETFES